MSENTTTSNLTADGDLFPSLTALRIAHSEMLTLHRKWGNVPEMKAKIEQLIKKGRATGALLDNEDDRWAAQSLLDYWNSLLYRAGQEPPDTTLVDFVPFIMADLDINTRFGLSSPTTITLNSPSRIPPPSPSPIPSCEVFQASPTEVDNQSNKLNSTYKTIKINKKISFFFLFIAGILLVPVAYSLKNINAILLSPISSPISSSILSEEINVKYSPNGDSVLIVAKGTARLWNLQGKLLSVIGKEGGISRAIFSPDSKLIAIINLDGNIELWDYQGRKKVTLEGNKSRITVVAFSPKGRFVATADSDKNLSLWNIQGTLLSVQKNRENIVSLVFNPDGKSILTANTNRIVHRWDLLSQDRNLVIKKAPISMDAFNAR
jgi:WD40 repeat protein